jgi:hypothetical protein
MYLGDRSDFPHCSGKTYGKGSPVTLIFNFVEFIILRDIKPFNAFEKRLNRQIDDVIHAMNMMLFWGPFDIVLLPQPVADFRTHCTIVSRSISRNAK